MEEEIVKGEAYDEETTQNPRPMERRSVNGQLWRRTVQNVRRFLVIVEAYSVLSAVYAVPSPRAKYPVRLAYFCRREGLGGIRAEKSLVAPVVLKPVRLKAGDNCALSELRKRPSIWRLNIGENIVKSKRKRKKGMEIMG